MFFFEQLKLVVLIADEHDVRHPEKQPGAGNARNRTDVLFELPRVGDGGDPAIENVVAVVGFEHRAVAVFKQHRLAPKLRETSLTKRQTERNHFDRQLPMRAQLVNELVLTDQDDYDALPMLRRSFRAATPGLAP